MSRAQDLFQSKLAMGDKITDGFYKVTSAKRRTLVPPKGFRLYDTDLNIIFTGDGTTNGGSVCNSREHVRIVNVAAAASGITVQTSGATTYPNSLTWAAAEYLRTGDAVTLAAGGGAMEIKKTTEKELMWSNGGPGVYACDYRKYYLLEEDEWR